MDEKRVIDPQTGGEKCSKPCRMDLIPASGMVELGKVYEFGAQKYEDHNWRKGYRWSLSIAAMLRHVWAWIGGETNDPESGCNHLAHAAWHCMTLIEFQRTHPDRDDRWRN